MSASAFRLTPAAAEPLAVRLLLLGTALVFLAACLLLPLAVVFREALRNGVGAYAAAVSRPDALAALSLTLLVAAVVVPLNAVFGVLAAWAVAKFRFRGRTALTTLFDLPFAVSPVVAGLLFVLMFGRTGWLTPLADALHLKVLFAVPGIVLATLFVTVPFVARELIPLMEAEGNDEEEAAILLGAGGLATFRRVTLPSIKWALLYGVILTTARAMGEFGAVSVVSGHIRGVTVTLPLEVEMRHAEFDTQAAFAVASLLTVLALVTLVAKQVLGARRWRRRNGTSLGSPAVESAAPGVRGPRPGAPLTGIALDPHPPALRAAERGPRRGGSRRRPAG